jgi:hypothetical protein
MKFETKLPTLKSMKEHQETQNYMFFGNLKTMKRLIDKMLEMDESKIDEMLKEHNWALDHIATSKDDVEEVFNFLAGHESEEDHGYATHDGSFDGDDSEELLGGPKSSHTEHDNHMRNQVEESIKSFKNFK